MPRPARFEELWAKQSGLVGTYPLLAHMLDSGAMAAALFEAWLRPGLQSKIENELGSNAQQIVAWLAGMHDIGKANPLFQYQSQDGGSQWGPIRDKLRANESLGEPDARLEGRWRQVPDLRRHERVSALEIAGLNLDRMTMGEAWKALPALGHHGYFTVPFLNEARPEILKRKSQKFLNWPGWSEAREELLETLSVAFRIAVEELPEECLPEVSILLSGLTVLADRLSSSNEWIASSRKRLKDGLIGLEHPQDWFEQQVSEAKSYIREHLGVYKGWESPSSAEADILQGRKPRQMQEKVRDSGPGLVTVMAPTGSGKTEAALLRHVQEEERLLFLLPTQATSNALMRRVQRAFSNTQNVASLAHGLASIEDFYNTPVTSFDDEDGVGCCAESGGLYPTSFVRSGMSRLMASVSVATVDQALKAGLRIKWIHLLLLSLANSHVVIDEVHTLDSYQTTLLSTVLEWLGRLDARVTLLSATIPSEQYRRLTKAYTGDEPNSDVVFPMVSTNNGKQLSTLDMTPEELQIELTSLDSPKVAEEHVRWVLNAHRKWPKARIGVICNRVAWAQEVAESLHASGLRVVVLHSAMTSAHRQQNASYLEKELGPGGEAQGVVVVGTQAIEASLDIDLDILTTDICPSTSLLQRAGRVWRRHDPQREARVPGLDQKAIRVVDAIAFDESMRYPYGAAELIRTSKWIRERSNIAIPSDCQKFVDAPFVSFEDLQRIDATDAEFDQFAIRSNQTRKAQSRSFALNTFMDPEARILDLHRTFGGTDTPSNSFDSLKTRDIEEETAMVILGDPTGKIPGAWVGSVEELKALNGYQQAEIRRALAASIPLREKQISRLLEESVDLSESKSIVGRYRYLDGRGIYNPLVGLQLSGHEEISREVPSK